MEEKKVRRCMYNRLAGMDYDDADDALMMMIMNLPRDIIFDILTRLPIESVVSCMSVCKLWSTFRYDSDFIDLHFTRSMIHPPAPTLILRPSFQIAPDDNLMKMNSLRMVSLGEVHWKARLIPMGFELRGFCLDIVGSCNGFVCIASQEGYGPICLFNPITREKYMLPKSHLFLPPTNISQMNIIGFGFDRLTMKYKVIRVYELLKFQVHENRNRVTRNCEIITVGESSWRKLDFPTLPPDQYVTHTVFLDGTLYWLVHKNSLNSYNNDYILALDIDTEKFWTINWYDCPLPRGFTLNRSLIQFDDSLAIIDHYYKTKVVDIWLIKGSKTMGFSFTLTTYDMSGIVRWGRYFTVMAKHGDDTFLIRVHKYMKGNPATHQLSLLLYSPVKKQLYLYVQGGFWTSDRLPGIWMVPTLKALNL